MPRKHCFSLALVFVGIALQAQVFTGANKPHSFSTTKKIVADKGAVVSAHALASEAGLLMLKKGGNAVDAAIATQLALAVVYPNAGNLGGGGFLVAQLKNENGLHSTFGRWLLPRPIAICTSIPMG